MAYPGSLLPSSFYVVENSVEATPPTNKKFIAFTSLGVGDVTFKSADDSPNLFVLNQAQTAYEAAGSDGVTLGLVNGQTIYGTFSSITATTAGVAYVG
jgi:hypothetical protein